MPENKADTNDIDALLRYLSQAAEDPRAKTPIGITAAGFYAALAALVAERNALREQLRLANIDQFNAEAEANDIDRELRERLVCAIWPEMLRSYSDFRDVSGQGYPWSQAKDSSRAEALEEADAMIAAMRKGNSDGK